MPPNSVTILAIIFIEYSENMQSDWVTAGHKHSTDRINVLQYDEHWVTWYDNHLANLLVFSLKVEKVVAYNKECKQSWEQRH